MENDSGSGASVYFGHILVGFVSFIQNVFYIVQQYYSRTKKLNENKTQINNKKHTINKIFLWTTGRKL